ncbi:MAG: ATP-binding protein [Muribaculaceae bacterium]|nr:ATP-binding protein [Muribaculaceae bacterium]
MSYIPADRNLVTAIPAWNSLPLDENLLEFMSNWDKARKFIGKEENILGLGLSYMYDKASNTDNILLENGRPLPLKESSSGVQSLFPMFVHLDYLTNRLYENDTVRLSYEQKEERKRLQEILCRKFQTSGNGLKEVIDDVEFRFVDNSTATSFKRIFSNFTQTHHSEIFLEEPEDNLFPPTQCQLVNWLVDSIKEHEDSLFVATHSPYILNQFIKADPRGLAIFFTHYAEDDSRLYTVRRLSESEIREIYDNGVDMFFNF